MIGFTKGDCDWHKVTEQKSVRDSSGRPRKVSVTKCALRLVSLDLVGSPDDTDPVCSSCNS